MSIFFAEAEREKINLRDPAQSGFFWHLLGQAAQTAATPGLARPDADTEWSHHVFETVTSVAAAVRLKNDPAAGEWLRAAALTLAGMPLDQWIGPWFRARVNPPVGHLETSHLSQALALALDLGGNVFSEEEKNRIATALREKAILLCRNWIEAGRHVTNWRCILLAGVAVPAAVLGDRDLLAFARDEYLLCARAFQPDGTYGESLQYSGYAAWGMMMTHEALLRSGTADSLPLPYAGIATWTAYSLIANRPLSGWGDLPRPRYVNFNDSGLIAAPSPDLMLHIAVRGAQSNPTEAATARYLFDTLFAPQPSQGPFDRSSFGFIPRYGFLTLPLLPQAPAPTAPAALGLPPAARFSCGPAIARSAWDDHGTVMAVSGVPDPLHCVGHLHADLNSVILAHDGEVFLADPGHSCYRNIIHQFEIATRAHNTCTFFDGGRELEQTVCGERRIDDSRRVAPPVTRPGRHLIAAGIDDVAVFASDAAEAYPEVVRGFTRCCIAAGGQAFFIIDRIDTAAPLRTRWNWLLNNRDGQLEYKVFPDRMVFRRGRSGMKMFYRADAPLRLDRHSGYVHDAYHPQPDRPGEGRNGSGLYFNLTETAPQTGLRTVVHAFALDSYGASAGWHFRTPDAATCELEYPGGVNAWSVTAQQAGFIISEKANGRRYRLSETNDAWTLQKL